MNKRERKSTGNGGERGKIEEEKKGGGDEGGWRRQKGKIKGKRRERREP